MPILQLGNNRGNKYSKKSVNCSPTSTDFWNFSIDEFAFHDIPDSISYVLETTGQPSLSYIGFSQGTAQAFASLAIHPKLNDQVNVFIALAPAMSPAGLSNGVVDALVKASPQVLFLLFGRRSILSSATMWQSILYPPLFTKVIDVGLSFLFGWKTQNISTSQKLAAYPHLYSFTSTKSVVHWFQIIRTKSFQMYDDDVSPPMLLSSSGKYTKVAKYPTRNIKTPIVLVYGGSDSLVDITVMLRELPRQTAAIEIPHYEHLDFLWARDVDTQVFRHVFDALESFTGAEHTREEYERYRSTRHNITAGGGDQGGRSSSSINFLPRHLLTQAADVADSDVSTAVGGGSVVDEGPAGSGPDQVDMAVVIAEEEQEEEEQPPQQSVSHEGEGENKMGDNSRPVTAQGDSRSIRSSGASSQREMYYYSGGGGGHGFLRPRHNISSPISEVGEYHEGPGGMSPSPSPRGSAQAGGGGEGRYGSEVNGGSGGGSGHGLMHRQSFNHEHAVVGGDGVEYSPIRTPKRRSTGGSQMSLDSMRAGRGISLGASESRILFIHSVDERLHVPL